MPSSRLRVLLVEDDETDAYLVRELLEEAKAPVDLSVASTLKDAAAMVAQFDCVLLDLGLPDAQGGLSGLRRLMELPHPPAVCVLTGHGDDQLGTDAVAVGAQDYLIKGEVDGTLLARAVRYAVERKRADDNARRLHEVELLQQESRRLEHGLLPQPLLQTDRVALHPFYQPGRRHPAGGPRHLYPAHLGGDFYDVVQTSPSRIALMVGDVCGHGVDEAALGVELRVAWRALTLAGVDEHAVLPAIEQVLISERKGEDVFATLAMATVDLEQATVEVRLAGHPPPLLVSGGLADVVAAQYGTVLGVFPDGERPVTRVPLGEDWALVLYTDGLIEGRVNGTDARLEVPGLRSLINDASARQVSHAELPAWLAARAEELNEGDLADDVAMLVLTTKRGDVA